MNILYSCSNLLIPELAENSARGNKKQIRRIVSKAMRTTSVFAVVIFVLCLIFADDIGAMIYKKPARQADLYAFIAGYTDNVYRRRNGRHVKGS